MQQRVFKTFKFNYTREISYRRKLHKCNMNFRIFSKLLIYTPIWEFIPEESLILAEFLVNDILKDISYPFM